MRDDVLQKMTTKLADCYGTIGIEDLNLKGLLKNRRLARSFSDAALGKLLNVLNAKVEQRAGQVITVGRFFLSTSRIWSRRVPYGLIVFPSDLFSRNTYHGTQLHVMRKYARSR
jgi:IS605 OrfB family transposase